MELAGGEANPARHRAAILTIRVRAHGCSNTTVAKDRARHALPRLLKVTTRTEYHWQIVDYEFDFEKMGSNLRTYSSSCRDAAKIDRNRRATLTNLRRVAEVGQSSLHKPW